ncbi:MAG TPA: GNAT family N-acetyltransferase [Acidimicrobiales bacterium]
MSPSEVETEQLLLRRWREEDKVPFAAMNSDPAVMEFFPAPLARAESDALVDRFDAELAERGFCPWAVELRESGTFIGFIGLHAVPEYLSFAPAVEVGWRLARPFWGRGFATEGAGGAVRFGFDVLELDEIVSFTSVVNLRSRRVMERLGMARSPDEDFEHPHVPEAHPLRPHVLYRLSGDQWRAR